MCSDAMIAADRPDKRCVAASFGRAAGSYDSVAVLQRRIGNRLLERLSFDSGQRSLVLDLGSGTGYCSALLASRGLCVIALDLARPMLLRARHGVPPPAGCVCADAEALPLKDRSIDCIVSNLAFQWCHDLDALFHECRRVLRPGGSLLFSSFGAGTLAELRRSWAQVDRASHVNRFFDAEAVQRAMQRAGLVQVEVEWQTSMVDYANVLSLMRELKGLGARNMTSGRPRGLTGRNRLARVVRAYEAMMPEGQVRATFEVLYGSGCRDGI